MPILGITGGIATGKSTLTQALLQHIPAEPFDADQCARSLAASNSFVKERIRESFGAEIYDDAGTLRRERLREVVFADPARRKQLETILHPVIREQWIALAEQARKDKKWLLVDIPLLFETRAQEHFDSIVVVACSQQIQLRRLMEIRKLDADTAMQMISAQLDMREKILHASHVIWNDGGESALHAQADALAGHLLQRFS